MQCNGGVPHSDGGPASISGAPDVAAALDPLFTLSDAIFTFKHCFQDLESHLRSIDAAMDSLSDNGLSQLEQLCATMCSRGFRRYIMSSLSTEPALRQSVPTALSKFAPDPAKLVLDCIGGFYLQGSRAFSHDSPLIAARSAAILALEFFLLSRDTESESKLECEGALAKASLSGVKEAAESVAIAWRKRMISEGGIAKASKLDARGLLLFISSFGIPSDFKVDDIIQLIQSSGWKDIVDALCRSPFLLPRIPGVLEEMMRKGMGAEAVDLIFGFHMEDKISPQAILTKSLREAKEACSTKKKGHSSLIAMKREYKRHVTALKSAIQCLKEHKLDPDKVLPGWQVGDMVVKFEKEIAQITKKIDGQSQTTTSDVRSSRILNTREIKRQRLTPEVAASLSHTFTGFQVPKDRPHTDNQILFDKGSFPVNSFDNRLLGQVNSYSAVSSLSHGIAVGPLTEASVNSTQWSPGVTHATGSVVRVGIPSATSVLSAAASVSYPGESLVEGIAHRVGSSDPRYGQHVYREPAFIEQRHPSASVRVGGLNRPSLEGFAGVPTHLSHGVLEDVGKPDLYGFCDTI